MTRLSGRTIGLTLGWLCVHHQRWPDQLHRPTHYMALHKIRKGLDLPIAGGPPMMNDACKNMLHDLGVEPYHVTLDDFGG